MNKSIKIALYIMELIIVLIYVPMLLVGMWIYYPMLMIVDLLMEHTIQNAIDMIKESWYAPYLMVSGKLLD